MGKELIDVFSNNLRKIMSNREVTQTDLMIMQLILDIKKDPRRSESLWG